MTLARLEPRPVSTRWSTNFTMSSGSRTAICVLIPIWYQNGMRSLAGQLFDGRDGCQMRWQGQGVVQSSEPGLVRAVSVSREHVSWLIGLGDGAGYCGHFRLTLTVT